MQPSPDNVSYKCWVDNFLPNEIPERIRRHVRIYFYNYDTYWKRDAVHTRLEKTGNNLLSIINSGLRATDRVKILPCENQPTC